MKTIALVVAFLSFSFTAEAALLNPGDRFPDWSLSDHTGQQLSSKDLAGKTYLLWYYPKAQTPGCTVEGQKLRDSSADFGKKKVEILGVSFDTPEDNAGFVNAESFPYRLLSDADRKLAVAVGAADAPDAGYAKRISYLVGGDGRVIKAYAKVNPATHAEEVLRDAP